MADINIGAPAPSLSQGELNQNENLMKSVAETIDREQKNIKAQQDFRRKTLLFNNSSYSGTDIKVLVHKYGTPTADLRSDLDRAYAAYSEVLDILGTLATTTIPRIAGLAAQFHLGDLSLLSYRIAIEEYSSAISEINTIESTIKDTGLIQFIGSSLSGRLVDAQANPESLITDINSTSGFLFDLIAGWKQQGAALKARQDELVNTKVLAELQTLSISTYREKVPVRACGYSSPKSFTRGMRSIAGSMIFTVFDRNVLFDLLETTSFDSDDQFRAAIKDQLPPIDISISFANEYGALSRMSIYGVEFISEGQTMSIEDIIMEDVCQFVARDVDPLTPALNEQGVPYNVALNNYNQAVAAGRGGKAYTDLRASDLRGSEWDIKPGRESAAVDRYKVRQNPFF